MRKYRRTLPLRHIARLLSPVVLATLVLLAVRSLLLTPVSLPPDPVVRGMEQGGHALVSLTHYGLRVPGETLWGYRRWGYRTPSVGDAMAYRLPDQEGLSVGICRAMPGEVIWIDPVRQKVLPARTSPDAQPITVPGRGRPVHVTPHNARLLAYVMRTYEACRVSVDGQGRLVLDGRPHPTVRLTNDYYWVETQPDSYVLIPHSALVGKLVCAVFPHGIRWPWFEAVSRY